MRVLIILIISTLSVSAFADGVSYKEWKNKRILEAKSLISHVKTQHFATPEEKMSRLERAEMQLEAEKELGPNDYFRLYLVDIFKKNPNLARKIAQKMSKQELAEVLAGYANETNRAHQLALTESP